MMSTCASVWKAQVEWEYSCLKNDHGAAAHSVAIDMPQEGGFCQISGYVFSHLTK